MQEFIEGKYLDEIDSTILNLLQNEAQLSNAEIARRVNLSPPATHARIRRLESEGYIERQVAILNQEKLGFDLLTFIFISTNIHQEEELSILENSLEKMSEVLECNCLTGDYDYLLKVVVRDRSELSQFVRKLNKLGISRIHTNLSLRVVKNTTSLPIEKN